MQWAKSGGCKALPSKVCKMAGRERRTDTKSQGHPERGGFEAADEDGKLTMILDGACKGKRSGDGNQKDVEEELCVMVNNSL